MTTPVKISALPTANTYNANTKIFVASVVGGKTLTQLAVPALLAASNSLPGFMSAADKVLLQQVAAANVSSKANTAYVDSQVATLEAAIAALDAAKANTSVVSTLQTTVAGKANSSSLRRLLAAPETWQINPATGNDATTDPLSTPFATLRAAWKYICRKIDMGGQVLTLQLSATGHYGFSTFGDTSQAPDNSYNYSYVPTGGGIVRIVGGTNTSNRDNYVILEDNDGYADYCAFEIYHDSPTAIEVQWCKIMQSSLGYGLNTLSLQNCHLAPTWSYANASGGARINITGDTKFAGTMNSSCPGGVVANGAYGPGVIFVGAWGTQITIDPTNINAAVPFFWADSGGAVAAFTFGGGATFSGTWPGPKYDVRNYARGNFLSNFSGGAGVNDGKGYSS